MLIAIDGPAASGKGTLAKNLARHYSLFHLDSGAVFRCIAKYIVDHPDRVLDDPKERSTLKENITASSLSNPDLRTEATAQKASEISQIPHIRTLFEDLCHQLIEENKTQHGSVIDGRDAGTVLFPNADIKFYLIVDPEERARRRYLELQMTDQIITYEDIYHSIITRDLRDMKRQESPLKPATDAHILDLTSETPEDVFNMAVSLINAKNLG